MDLCLDLELSIVNYWRFLSLKFRPNEQKLCLAKIKLHFRPYHPSRHIQSRCILGMVGWMGHRFWNSIPDGLRPSTLPLGFFETWMTEWGTNPQSPIFHAGLTWSGWQKKILIVLKQFHEKRVPLHLNTYLIMCLFLYVMCRASPRSLRVIYVIL